MAKWIQLSRAAECCKCGVEVSRYGMLFKVGRRLYCERCGDTQLWLLSAAGKL